MVQEITGSQKQNHASILKQDIATMKKNLGWSLLAGLFAAVATSAALAYLFAQRHIDVAALVNMSAGAGLSAGCATTIAIFGLSATILHLRRASLGEPHSESIPLEKI